MKMKELIEVPEATRKLLARIRKSFKNEILPELKQREFPGARKRRRKQQPRIAHPRMPLAEALMADMESMQFGFEIVGVQIIGRTTDTSEYLIVLDKKKQRYDAYKRWNFPGGHLESPNEEPIEAARRETNEEAGIDIRQNPIVRVGLVRLYPRPGATAAAYAAVFFTIITPDQRQGAHPGDEQEEDGLKFVSEAELEKMISEKRFHGNHVNGLREFKRWRANATHDR